MRRRGSMLLLVALLAACTAHAGPPAAAPSGPVPTSVPSPVAIAEHGEWPDDATDVGIEQPPPFEVRHDDAALVLHPHTFCYGAGCADGVDESPPAVGSPAEIYVRVPVAAYTELRVGGEPLDNRCEEPADEYAVEPLGAGWWRVTPRGDASERRVTLVAGGDGSGDMVANLLWTTPPGDAEPTVCG